MARLGRKDRGLYSKLREGRAVWFVRLYHLGRESRFGSFPTKTAAREFYEKAKREQKEGLFFPERYRSAGTETIETLIDHYLIGHSGNTKSQRDERRFGAWWKARLKGHRLQSVTPAILEDARQFLLTEKTPVRILRSQRFIRNVKQARSLEGSTMRQPATVNRYCAWLRKVLNVAVRDKKIQSNPVSRLKFAKESRGKTRFLTPGEEATVCNALGPVYASWVRLAILTGMRQAEQFSLKWAQVDLGRGLVTLPRTKAGELQYVRLNDEARQILRELTIGNRSIWVFPSETQETHLDPRNFYERIWIPAVKRAGIEWVTWHDLRHTFASRLAMAGHNDGTIAALLRHSSTALVKRYAHLSPSHLDAALESVAAFGKERERAVGETGTDTRQAVFSNGTGSETGMPECREMERTA